MTFQSQYTFRKKSFEKVSAYPLNEQCIRTFFYPKTHIKRFSQKYQSNKFFKKKAYKIVWQLTKGGFKTIKAAAKNSLIAAT